MHVFNYSVLAKDLWIGHSKPNMLKTARLLFGVITDNYEILTAKGNVYQITGTEAGKWFRGEADIYNSLKIHANEESVKSQAVRYFKENVMTELIMQNKAAEICNLLLRHAQEDPKGVGTGKISQLQNFLNNEQYAEFLCAAFFLALSADNTGKEYSFTTDKLEQTLTANVNEDVQNAIATLAKLSKTIHVNPPIELQPNEMPYVTALLEAISIDIGYSISSRKEIPNKQQHFFARQRKYFYDAESVRQSTRDCYALQNRHDFDDLKDEIEDGIIDICEDPTITGIPRLIKTHEHVACLQLSSLLSQIPNWVGPSERKGICHMLVNDGKIRWVDP